MENLFEQMLAQYDIHDKQSRRNALYEVTQQIALAGLYRGGFFDKAAFYGGTCLRIFHGLERYSEDMDFTLLKRDDNFCFEDYFQPIIDEFKAVGRKVEIKKKDKRMLGKVESAFLKDNTDVYNLSFQTEKAIKVKIEADIQPPLLFDTEQLLLTMPNNFYVRCVTLPCLFAGKMHALVFRNWKARVKGRDWYDFAWYVSHRVKLNFSHLQQRIKDFNGIEMSKDDFVSVLRERLSSTDIEAVKDDVRGFLDDEHALDIWSNDYFLQLADKIIYSD